ncbi:MAG TPA: S-methyl-5'-thioadenosine phosphorylase [Armatimonadota bacterium]|nr:S-methyl-5'-thioadenosine phosphorylase [Armatimonadota bacterium]
MRFGVIGGTGVYRLTTGEKGGDQMEVETAYGGVLVDRIRLADAEVAFIARHGGEHNIPPHRVNYRGNIAALKKLGVTNILASAAVGSLVESMPPGALSVLTQFIDWTRGRPSTFFDGEGGEVVHVDMTEPYCPHLREELSTAAEALGEKVHLEATYVCAEGPRFETPAEIRMFRQMGGDLVGMTSVPEVVLAREAGICYAAVAIVTNWAAGVSGEPVEHGRVSEFMGRQTPRVRALFEEAISAHKETDCSCRTWASE